MGLLDTSGADRGDFASCLGGELLARGFATSGLACRLMLVCGDEVKLSEVEFFVVDATRRDRKGRDPRRQQNKLN